MPGSGPAGALCNVSVYLGNIMLCVRVWAHFVARAA